MRYEAVVGSSGGLRHSVGRYSAVAKGRTFLEAVRRDSRTVKRWTVVVKNYVRISVINIFF